MATAGAIALGALALTSQLGSWWPDLGRAAADQPLHLAAGAAALALAGILTVVTLSRCGWTLAAALVGTGTLLVTPLPAAGLLAPSQALLLGIGASLLTLGLPSLERRLAVATSATSAPPAPGSVGRRTAALPYLALGLLAAGSAAGMAALIESVGATGPGAVAVAMGRVADPAPFAPPLLLHRLLEASLGARGGALVFVPMLGPALLVAARRRDTLSRALLAAAAIVTASHLAWAGPEFLGAPAALGGRLGFLLAPLLFWAAWGPRSPGVSTDDATSTPAVGARRPPAIAGLAAAWGIHALVAASAALPFDRQTSPPDLVLVPTPAAIAVTPSAGVSPKPGASWARLASPRPDRGIFAWLPFETTAATAPDALELAAGPGNRHLWLAGPTAHGTTLIVATQGPEWPIRMLVSSPCSDLTLAVRDWTGGRDYPLEGNEDGVRALLELEVGPGWRLHPLPAGSAEPPRSVALETPGAGSDEPARSHATPWAIRVLTIAAVESSSAATPAQPTATAPPTSDAGLDEPSVAESGPSPDAVVPVRVALLGNASSVAEALAAASPGFSLPATAVAGTASWLDVPLVNQGTLPWDPAGPVQVVLSYGLHPEPVGVRAAVDGTRSRFAAVVWPGQRLSQALRLRWPDRPGRYWVAVDLMLEDLVWFEEHRGVPLASGWVDVRPAERGTL